MNTTLSKTKQTIHQAINANYTPDTSTHQWDESVSRLFDAFADQFAISDIISTQPMNNMVNAIYHMQYAPDQTKNEDNIDRHTLQVLSTAVNAHSYRLGLTIDIDAFHEVCKSSPSIVGSEICQYMHNIIMDIMYRSSACVNFRIDLDEKPMDILNKLHEACHIIGNTSHRGRANKIILPYELYTHLYPILRLAPYNSDAASGGLWSIGTHNGIDLYVSTRNTVVLVGYANKSNIDAGIIICPYQLIPHIDSAAHLVSFEMLFGTYIANNVQDYHISIQVRF